MCLALYAIVAIGLGLEAPAWADEAVWPGTILMSNKAIQVEGPDGQTLDLEPRTLVGLIDMEGDDLQRVLVFSTGHIAVIPRADLDRSMTWVPAMGALVQSPDQPEPLPAFAESADGQFWVRGVDGTPVLIRAAAVDPGTEAVQTVTPVLIRPGETAAINCPDVDLMPKPGARGTKIPAVGEAQVWQAPSPQVRVEMRGRAGLISEDCGETGPLRVADFAPSVDLRTPGDQPLLVHFWATWCKPCIEELDAYGAFVERVGRQHSIAVSEDFDSVTPHVYLAKHRHGFRSAYDTDGQVFQRLGGGETMPFNAIIGPDGQVLETWMGRTDWASPEIAERIGITEAPGYLMHDLLELGSTINPARKQPYLSDECASAAESWVASRSGEPALTHLRAGIRAVREATLHDLHLWDVYAFAGISESRVSPALGCFADSASAFVVAHATAERTEVRSKLVSPEMTPDAALASLMETAEKRGLRAIYLHLGNAMLFPDEVTEPTGPRPLVTREMLVDGTPEELEGLSQRLGGAGTLDGGTFLVLY